MTIPAAESRAAAYERLGVTPAAATAAPQITPQLRMIQRKTHRRFDYYLRASAEPEARAFLALYDQFPQSIRRLLPVEAFCVAASIPPLDLLNVIKSVCVSMKRLESTVIAISHHPDIVENTAFIAQHGLTADTRLAAQNVIHRAVGFTPVPKSSQTTINVSQQQAIADTKSLAPPPELTIRRLQDRFNESRPSLPAAAPAVIDAEPLEEENE